MEPTDAPTMVPVEGWEPPSDELAPVEIPVGLGLKEALASSEVELETEVVTDEVASEAVDEATPPAPIFEEVDETVLKKV